MIFCLKDTGEAKTSFVITPNRAMPWHQLVWIYSIFAAFTLGIATGFFIKGLVLILPFAGLEILALGVVLYVSAWRGGVREVITITEDKVRVESGRSAPEYSHEFDLAWVQVVLERPWHNWYPSNLFLRSHGQQVQIGCFLNEEERQGLANELVKAIKNKD